MRTKHLILVLFSLFLLNACQQRQNGVYNVMDYGAAGDGKTDDATAIQQAVDACSAAGGGTVLLPSGHTFLCGPLKLASDVNFIWSPTRACWPILTKVFTPRALLARTVVKA